MDKQIKNLNKASTLSNDDKVIIQQSGGGTLNTTVGDLSNLIIDKIKDMFLIVKEEIIYQYEGDGHANFDRTVNLISGKKFSDYQYVEIYVKTDDGYINMAKVHDPQPGKTVTITLANIGGSAYFFCKCRCYTLQESSITTTTFISGSKTEYMAGTWWYREELITGTSGKQRMPGEFNEKLIGIAKIVGYK